jgi:hypothetical protein
MQIWGLPPPPSLSLPVGWHADLSLSLTPHARVSSSEACLASHLAASMSKSVSHGSPWLPPRPCTRTRVQQKDRIVKAAKMGPNVLTLTLAIPLHKGIGLALRVRLTTWSRTLWIRASTYTALNSSEERRSGQLDPRYAHILNLRLRSS